MSKTQPNASMTNKDFIEAYLNNSSEVYVLPHEQIEAVLAMQHQEQTLQEIVKAKIDVTGGDDWHDGAFRATDSEANIVRERMQTLAPYVNARVVDYPLASEVRVTLGSRINIQQNNYIFPVDIVGYKSSTDHIDPISGEEVMNATLNSPLAKAVFGKLIDACVDYRLGDKNINARVISIDQNAMREQFSTL